MNKNFLLVLLVVFTACGSRATKSSSQPRQASEFIVKRAYYELSYNEDFELANWVFYTLESSQLQSCVKRLDNFRSDPMVVTGSSDLEDFRNSGFDRGHLLPAGDMKFSKSAMSDTFFLSNIAPQPKRFNRGLWAQLEEVIRAWTRMYKKVWIVTGPVLHPSLPTIGVKNRVAVPREFYKVVLRKDGSRFRGVGVIMQTSLPYPDLAAYAVDIDTVEKITGIDFFPFLTSQQEKEAEGQFNENAWDFTQKFEYLPCSSSGAR